MFRQNREIAGIPPETLFRFRREFLARTLGIGAGVVGVAGLSRPAMGQAVVNDAAILNFALNLEYLEAEFYTYATTGSGIEAFGIGVNGQGTPGTTLVKPNPKVPFQSQAILQYANEIADDERTHVVFLRNALAGSGFQPVARPAIDLLNSFNAAASAAGLGASFDPFANDTAFLLGSYIFEDVGVTAYHGAAPLIKNKDILGYAAGILGTEAYHAGLVRGLLFGAGQGAATGAISSLRASASNAPDDYGVASGPNGTSSIVLTDSNALVFARTTTQVLNIVYLEGQGEGGFFPAGLNGAIR
jgi:hypothetical protein